MLGYPSLWLHPNPKHSAAFLIRITSMSAILTSLQILGVMQVFLLDCSLLVSIVAIILRLDLFVSRIKPQAWVC